MKIEFAKSLSGHDKNCIYIIWKKEERFAWLVNGTTHTTENPKKKNIKHFQIIKNVPEVTQPLTNDIIRQAVKAYERSINK